MRTLPLSIITGIGIITIVILSIFIFFQSIIPGTLDNIISNSLDLSNPTNENSLGISGQVIIEPDRSIECPVKCVIPPTPHLVLTSNTGAQFIGYQVCDGNSCKKDKLENSLYVRLNQIPLNYTGPMALTASHVNLGDLPWNVGDAVHIIVKAFPVTLEPNNIIIREPEKTAVVDLGESKIIDYKQIDNSFPLHLKVYVANPADTNHVDMIKVDQPYQVIAQVTRQENQSLIYYYCIVQVQNEKGIDIADGWNQETLIPNQSSSECAIRWVPDNTGNYTISAFAWQDLHGTPKAEPAIENVQVLR